MNEKNQIKKLSKIIHKLYLKEKWATSKLGRFIRMILFNLGFTQCKYCTYFKPEYGNHQTNREGPLLTKGKCDFANFSGVDISKKQASKFKRCPIFVTALYNVTGNNIPKEETKNILLRRQNYFFSWLTIIIAIAAAFFSWGQRSEAKKERIKAEDALREVNQIKKTVSKIATVLFKINYITADGSGRYGGTPPEHIDKIDEYRESLSDYLDKDLEAEAKKDINELHEEIRLRNTKNP